MPFNTDITRPGSISRKNSGIASISSSSFFISASWLCVFTFPIAIFRVFSALSLRSLRSVRRTSCIPASSFALILSSSVSRALAIFGAYSAVTAGAIASMASFCSSSSLVFTSIFLTRPIRALRCSTGNSLNLSRDSLLSPRRVCHSSDCGISWVSTMPLAAAGPAMAKIGVAIPRAFKSFLCGILDNLRANLCLLRINSIAKRPIVIAPPATTAAVYGFASARAFHMPASPAAETAVIAIVLELRIPSSYIRPSGPVFLTLFSVL